MALTAARPPGFTAARRSRACEDVGRDHAAAHEPTPDRTTRHPDRPPAPEGAFPPWLATAGGFTVLVAASLWIPALVTVLLGLVVLALSATVLHRAATAAGAGGGHGLAGLVTATLGLLLVGLLSLPGGLADEGGGLSFDPTPPAGATRLRRRPRRRPRRPPRRRPTASRSGCVPPRWGVGHGRAQRRRRRPDGHLRSRQRRRRPARHGLAGRRRRRRPDPHLPLRPDRAPPHHRPAARLRQGRPDQRHRPVPTEPARHHRHPPPRRLATGRRRFTDAPDLQWIEVDAETTALVAEITGTTGAAERDYTAVSEVQFTGWPAG
jgi:hypothetical protein